MTAIRRPDEWHPGDMAYCVNASSVHSVGDIARVVSAGDQDGVTCLCFGASISGWESDHYRRILTVDELRELPDDAVVIRVSDGWRISRRVANALQPLRYALESLPEPEPAPDTPEQRPTFKPGDRVRRVRPSMSGSCPLPEGSEWVVESVSEHGQLALHGAPYRGHHYFPSYFELVTTAADPDPDPEPDTPEERPAFKPGDVVRRVRANRAGSWAVPEGSEWVVESVDAGGWLALRDAACLGAHDYDPDYFELVTPAPDTPEVDTDAAILAEVGAAATELVDGSFETMSGVDLVATLTSAFSDAVVAAAENQQLGLRAELLDVAANAVRWIAALDANTDTTEGE